jgi:hypothetical protein
MPSSVRAANRSAPARPTVIPPTASRSRAREVAGCHRAPAELLADVLADVKDFYASMPQGKECWNHVRPSAAAAPLSRSS